MHAFRRLLRYLRPHRRWMIATVVTSFIAAALDAVSLTLLIPFLQVLFAAGADPAAAPPAPSASTAALPESFRQLETLRQSFSESLDRLVDPADKMGSLYTVILVILAAVVAKNVFVWISGLFGARLQEYVTRDLRNELYAHIGRLPLGYFTRTATGQMMARVLTDTQQTKLLITQLVTQSLQNIAVVTLYLTFMLLMSVQLPLVALIAAPAVIGLLQPLLRKLRSRYRRLGNQYGDMTS